jgi:hypothetical protein
MRKQTRSWSRGKRFSSPLVGSPYPAISIITAVFNILAPKVGQTGEATFMVLLRVL